MSNAMKGLIHHVKRIFFILRSENISEVFRQWGNMISLEFLKDHS